MCRTIRRWWSRATSSPKKYFRWPRSCFGDWPRREKDPFVEFPLVEHPSLPKSEGVIIKQPVQNVIFSIGWHGPSIGKDNAATYAADVFSFILRQPNSRFQRAPGGLRPGYRWWTWVYYTQRNVGPINVIAQTTPDKARAAIRAIYTEMSHFNDKDYFTDEQLESAKALLEADDTLFTREAERICAYADRSGGPRRESIISAATCRLCVVTFASGHQPLRHDAISRVSRTSAWH